MIYAIELYPWAIYLQVNSPHYLVMDKYEQRRLALQSLISDLGWGGVTKVAEKIGKAPSYVSRMLLPTSKAGYKRIGEDTVDSLTAAFPGWLAIPSKTFSVSNIEPALPADRTIPVISYVQAGNWRDIVDNNPIGYSDDTIPARGEYGMYTFALRIMGNSMEPEFREGDVVVIDPDVAPTPGDYVVARNHVEAATFKKYRPRGVDERGHPIFELVPLNDDYAVMRSDQEPIQIIGTMVEHTRFRKR